MSGGTFEYIQHHWQLSEFIEIASDNICNNPYEFSDETLNRFKEGISFVNKAKIYLHRIDYLLAGDDSEQSFLKRIKEDLNESKTDI